MNWSSTGDTYWSIRGALCILNELVGSKGVFMETEYKQVRTGTTKYQISQFDPENPNLTGFTAYYARQSTGIVPPDEFRAVRFAIGDPNEHGGHHYIVEYDFT